MMQFCHQNLHISWPMTKLSLIHLELFVIDHENHENSEESEIGDVIFDTGYDLEGLPKTRSKYAFFKEPERNLMYSIFQ
jgi:hypothetical protein